MKYILVLTMLVLSACSAKDRAYRFILDEKEKNIYDAETGIECKISGYDIVPDVYTRKKARAVLIITFENCSVTEKIILDERTKPQWGVQQDPKRKFIP